MFHSVALLQSEDSGFADHSRFSIASAKRLSVVVLVLTMALICASCGTVAQAAGAGTQAHDLALFGNLPVGAIHQSYNAVLAVSGGNSPYSFTVKTGTLPPGISLNAATGSLSGTPTASGNFSFEVLATDLPHPDQGSHAFFIVVNGTTGGRAGGHGGVTIGVSPASVTLSSNQTQQFTANVTGTSNTAVAWSATGGTVDSNGLYTAPTVTTQTNLVVTATSSADPSASASAAVTVDPANRQALQITTGGLPQGQQGSPYSDTFAAVGGTAPYSWSISAGTPPAGIAMNANGTFSGMPTTTGTFNFTVTVTDASGKTASANFSVTVTGGSGYDGPAQLPIATVSSSMADTPAPGSVISVKAGNDLQSALNSAQCGNTIELQAGATFTGAFQFPALNCDNNHWIIVRTSSPDSALPAEGQRLTPCYAGVASLPGRPQYPCNNPQNVLAKLVVPSKIEAGPIVFQSGANHYRLVGLELTRLTGTGGAPDLISLDLKGTASYIVLDRSWLHGTTQDETRDGFNLSGSSNVAVVDSYFSDFHCIASTGTCTDSHAVSGGTGDNQDGPYKIVDNFLEAAGEAVMFGGGGATLTPTDISIQYNHFFKPMQWMRGNNPFVGGADGRPFVVKNHLELKNAVRVLVEANLMENSWGGFTQTGFGILLTPKNQHTIKHGNVCPICEVTDVTVRYTHIAHGGGGMQLATSTSGDGEGGGDAKAGTRWSIHDVVMDDISVNYDGPGTLFEVMNGWSSNPLNTVTINHITAFADPKGGIMFLGNKLTNPTMYAFVFTNSIVATGGIPVWNSGGGDASCAVKDVPVTSFNSCFSTYTFNTNALVAVPSHFPPSSWPKGNSFAQSVTDVEFVNYGAGNYQLQTGSPYTNMGTDGKNLGADIVGLNEALANVE